MEFHLKRRQQFLSEQYYSYLCPALANSVRLWQTTLPANGTVLSGRALAFGRAARINGDLFLLRYTAGEPLDTLRVELTAVVEGYELATEHLRAYSSDKESAPLRIARLEDYERTMQLIGLCFLFRRVDLLPRIGAMLAGDWDGHDKLYEDFLSYEIDDRFEVDALVHRKPYRHLLDSLYRESDESIQDIVKYLKAWYPSMKDATWHDSHLDLSESGAGYFGYWAIEAAAAVFLLDVSDAAFREHVAYPKDLVDFARTLDAVSVNGQSSRLNQMRVEGGHPCPQAGYWSTPAQLDSRRLFKVGEIMPTFEQSAYGATIWQWSEEQ